MQFGLTDVGHRRGRARSTGWCSLKPCILKPLLNCKRMLQKSSIFIVFQ